MLRYSFILLFLMAAARLMAQNVTINGMLENNETYTEIILQRFGRQADEVARSPISEDGRFQFALNIDKTDFFRLYLAEKNFAMLILSPGENVKFTALASNMSINLSVEGSEHSRLIYRTGMRVTQYEMKLDSLEKAYQAIYQVNQQDPEIERIRSEYLKTDMEFKGFLKHEIEKNPTSPAFLFFIEKLDKDKYLNTYILLDDSLSIRYPYIFYVQNLHNLVQHEKRLGIGGLAPDIRLPNPAGDTLSLSDYRGKVVLIDFWAGWCGPCRRENPNLVRLYNEYKDDGFEILGVSLDRTRDSWVNAIAADGITWPQVSDLLYWKSPAAKTYGVSAIPHTVLIDRDGRIIANKLRGESLEDKLRELFQE